MESYKSILCYTPNKHPTYRVKGNFFSACSSFGQQSVIQAISALKSSRPTVLKLHLWILFILVPSWLDSYSGNCAPSPWGRANRIKIKVGDSKARWRLLLGLQPATIHHRTTHCRQVCCHHAPYQRRRALWRDRGCCVGRFTARSTVAPQAL